MKTWKQGIFGVLVLFALTLTACDGDDDDGGGGFTQKYSIGDTGPGGGKIFYVSTEGFTVFMVNPAQNYTAHYLEAAPEDMPTTLAWASSAYLTPPHGTGSDIFIKDTEVEIGKGRKNTDIILAIDAEAPAALACKNLTTGGKTDWFLPSDLEQARLYMNRAAVGNFAEDWYWSSSEREYLGAFSRSFVEGGSTDPVSKLKSDKYSVRAVRAF